MSIARTARLDLVPLPAAVVRDLLEPEPPPHIVVGAYELPSAGFAGDGFVLGLRHAQLREHPDHEPWLLRAMIDRSAGALVGKAGFHAPPDGTGTVEIGYRVDEAYRRRGYATEAVVGLLGWGARHGAKRFLASVSPDNEASLAIVRRLGFTKIGEQMDEIDGLELVFARSGPP